MNELSDLLRMRPMIRTSKLYCIVQYNTAEHYYSGRSLFLVVDLYLKRVKFLLKLDLAVGYIHVVVVFKEQTYGCFRFPSSNTLITLFIVEFTLVDCAFSKIVKMQFSKELYSSRVYESIFVNSFNIIIYHEQTIDIFYRVQSIPKRVISIYL